jgi:hypothetical protein
VTEARAASVRRGKTVLTERTSSCSHGPRMVNLGSQGVMADPEGSVETEEGAAIYKSLCLNKIWI